MISSQVQHLESWPPGIKVYRHVWTMYMTCRNYAVVCTCHIPGSDMYIHFWKCLDMKMYGHVCTFPEIYKHVCTWYVHGIYIWRYKHTCKLFRGECTCIYMYTLLFTYFLFTYMYMYVKVCTADVSFQNLLMAFHGYIHFMKCTDIIKLCTYTDVFFWF